ncbi:MAG TPA: helix-turn-helix transcriptional regulator [Kribbella sp.]|uniref:helix-turn-helix transcriptional regulator n=1 Tax=Kribbella sp. TaxID=1871183 RepID=UPI002D77E1B5|nr:helix-turn-helix transcriptional regulator [Kribbella sp.]HET6295381.1 helix-turn-helix transcriptional regulator [Kribbella sp.]
MDRVALAEFLRSRREALQPEDVGMPRGQRRRTPGLRREELAVLSGMSTDYYSRIERGAGPQPSEQMIAAIARALHLTLDERDHLFTLSGYTAPGRGLRAEHVNPGMMRVLDRLDDTAAQVVSSLGVTLLQTPLAVALLGDQMGYTGHARSLVYRWFTDLDSRRIYPEEDHEHHGRVYTAQLRAAVTREGPRSQVAHLAEILRAECQEFAEFWAGHEIGLSYTDQKRFIHPEVGELSLHCQLLIDPDQSQSLVVFTARAGTEDADKLRLLSVIGNQTLFTH